MLGKKLSPKAGIVAGAAAIAIDVVGDLLLGHWLDNRTNKKRAAKADALAQEQVNNPANIDEEA